MISFNGRHFEKEMIVQSIRWYLAYSLSYRDIEEIMKERGFKVDHSTIQRWVIHYAPQLEKAALRFLTKAIERNAKPGLVDIDKSGANTVAIQDYNNDHGKRIKIRQCKCLNNIVEQDHRHIKRRARATLGFKSFRSAQATLAGIELTHMIKKGQARAKRGDRLSPAAQFYALAA